MVWLLTLVVLLPTACVLWFMTQAMQNERLAVQQKLVDVYHGQLDVLRDQLDDFWAHRAAEFEELATSETPGALFSVLVGSGRADSAIIYNASGGIAYPSSAEPISVATETSPEWEAAFRVESRQGDALAAAQAYARIASTTSDPNEGARALQAQARCLARVQQVDDAVQLLAETLAGEAYAHAVDRRGRLIVADAELRALQLMDSSDERRHVVLYRLTSRVTDYRNHIMPSAQRRFLMGQLTEYAPETLPSIFVDAEELASRWLLAEAEPTRETSVVPSSLSGVWELSGKSGSVVALYTDEGLTQRFAVWAHTQALPPGVDLQLISPGTQPPSQSLAITSAGQSMPGWRLSFVSQDPTLFETSAERQVAAYLWTGVLVIASTLVMTVLIAWAVRRQIRVARLKNDIVATVSHELKTPLASMRLLIDTLLDAEEFEPRRVREYLYLIGRENTRLSRLIENFLTFSRLEQDRYAFNPTELQPMDIIDAASQAVRDRFQSSGCRFDIEAAPGLPMLLGDADALVTAVVNLLDNAYKYSSDDKHIVLRAFAEGESVCFQVQDNGIGISRSGSRNVFKRFYQVDQTLSGISTGVGLGLSIVRAIVQAHGGKIDLDSEPGKGSTFTIKVPVGVDSSSQVGEARSDVA